MNISDLSSRISVYGGTGFIGSRFIELYGDRCVLQPRHIDCPYSNNLLYLISTTDNYNVLDNLRIDAETNIVKLLDVLQNCRSSEFEINFVSSWFVYGVQDTFPVKEDVCCRPTGFYSITKKAAEDLLISFCTTYKVPYRVFRLANIFGSTDKRASKKKNALHYIVGKLRANELVQLYKEPIVRDYLFVDDACRAMKMCMDDKSTLNQVINIGSGAPTNFQQLIHNLKHKLKSTSTIEDMPAPTFHNIVQAREMVLDTTKIAALGFKPTVSVEDFYTT